MDEKVMKAVRRVARNMARRTGAEFDDLNQEGLVAAWLAAGTWDGLGEVESWCAVNAKWAMSAYFRRVHWDYKRVAQRPAFAAINDTKLPSVQPTAPMAAEVAQALKLINRTPMRKEWREALLATTVGDMSRAEYAASIGATDSRVWQMVSGAIRSVRERINERHLNN